VEDGGILDARDPSGRLVERVVVDVRGAPVTCPELLA
jgi:hypothetical protein